jgi:hypothetical protein
MPANIVKKIIPFFGCETETLVFWKGAFLVIIKNKYLKIISVKF